MAMEPSVTLETRTSCRTSTSVAFISAIIVMTWLGLGLGLGLGKGLGLGLRLGLGLGRTEGARVETRRMRHGRDELGGQEGEPPIRRLAQRREQTQPAVCSRRQ